MRIMEESGTAVVELSDAVYADMKELAQPLYEEIRGQVGDELVDFRYRVVSETQ